MKSEDSDQEINPLRDWGKKKQTTDGQDYYESQKADHVKKTEKTWEKFKALLEEYGECDKQLKTLRDLENVKTSI